jgi:hypothetical protein
MTIAEKRTEAIVAKWDKYYDDFGGRRKPRRKAERRHYQRYSVDDMTEKLRAQRLLGHPDRANGARAKYTGYSAVIATYPDGRKVKYASAIEAANALNVKVATIYGCVAGWMNTVKGATLTRVAADYRQGGKPVIARYPDGRVVRYNSVKGGAKAAGVSDVSISRCLHGYRADVRGIKWECAK